MDRRERLEMPQDALLAALEGWQSGLWTAMPGIVQSFDAQEVTCSVQVAIQMQLRSPTGEFRWESITPLIHVPVLFPGGGGCTLTFPVEAGDECLVVFASRCIDSWWQSGGFQNPQVEMRMHDLSDGFALVGVRSQARPLPSISGSSAQLRTDTGTAFVGVNATTGEITLKSPLKIKLEAPDLDIAANITHAGTFTSNGKNVGSTHNHGGVAPGGSNTAGPNP